MVTMLPNVVTLQSLASYVENPYTQRDRQIDRTALHGYLKITFHILSKLWFKDNNDDDERLGNPPQGNQEHLVVKSRMEDPQLILGE